MEEMVNKRMGQGEGKGREVAMERERKRQVDGVKEGRESERETRKTEGGRGELRIKKVNGK